MKLYSSPLTTDTSEGRRVPRDLKYTTSSGPIPSCFKVKIAYMLNWSFCRGGKLFFGGTETQPTFWHLRESWGVEKVKALLGNDELIALCKDTLG